MAKGDTADMVRRLKRVLPRRWTADNTPVLDALLSGMAIAWAGIYDLQDYVRRQGRIATATSEWTLFDQIAFIAQDFLGGRLPRKPGEEDGSYRARIRFEILRPRATRPSIRRALVDLTGHDPLIIEPANAADTGGYGPTGGMGYGMAGRYGSVVHPYQAFLTVYRPPRQLGSAAGVDGYGGYLGGYGVGAVEYADSKAIAAQTSDADIYGLIASLQPAATVPWTRIVDKPPSIGSRLDDDFVLDESELADDVAASSDFVLDASPLDSVGAIT